MPAISEKISAGEETVYRAVKTLAVWSAIAFGAYLLFPIVSQYVSSTQVTAIVVALNAMATISLWRDAARKPPRPKKEFLQKLNRSEPIMPKHDPPKAVGGAFSSLATEHYRRFYAEFSEFAEVVNWWLADEHIGGPWRLQELPDGYVRLNVDDSSGPILGRSYTIFHNQVPLGRLEISPGYSTAGPAVRTEIQLEWVRLLSFESVSGFLRDIAMHVCDKTTKADLHFNVDHAIANALTQALWQTQEITEFEDLDGQGWGELSLHLHGHVPDWYFQRRDAVRNWQHV
jgi:hypothetical protein